jgi:hypothetical protein
MPKGVTFNRQKRYYLGFSSRENKKISLSECGVEGIVNYSLFNYSTTKAEGAGMNSVE